MEQRERKYFCQYNCGKKYANEQSRRQHHRHVHNERGRVSEVRKQKLKNTQNAAGKLIALTSKPQDKLAFEPIEKGEELFLQPPSYPITSTGRLYVNDSTLTRTSPTPLSAVIAPQGPPPGASGPDPQKNGTDKPYERNDTVVASTDGSLYEKLEQIRKSQIVKPSEAADDLSHLKHLNETANDQNELLRQRAQQQYEDERNRSHRNAHNETNPLYHHRPQHNSYPSYSDRDRYLLPSRPLSSNYPPSTPYVRYSPPHNYPEDDRPRMEVSRRTSEIERDRIPMYHRTEVYSTDMHRTDLYSNPQYQHHPQSHIDMERNHEQYPPPPHYYPYTHVSKAAPPPGHYYSSRYHAPPPPHQLRAEDHHRLARDDEQDYYRHKGYPDRRHSYPQHPGGAPIYSDNVDSSNETTAVYGHRKNNVEQETKDFKKEFHSQPGSALQQSPVDSSLSPSTEPKLSNEKKKEKMRESQGKKKEGKKNRDKTIDKKKKNNKSQEKTVKLFTSEESNFTNEKNDTNHNREERDPQQSIRPYVRGPPSPQPSHLGPSLPLSQDQRQPSSASPPAPFPPSKSQRQPLPASSPPLRYPPSGPIPHGYSQGYGREPSPPYYPHQTQQSHPPSRRSSQYAEAHWVAAPAATSPPAYYRSHHESLSRRNSSPYEIREEQQPAYRYNVDDRV